MPNSRWIFPPEEAKGGKQPRIIYLNETAREITERFVKRFRKGPIFRKTRKAPWTTDAVNCRFATLKKKLGIRYCLYTLRHTWATNALKKGVDPITVSANGVPVWLQTLPASGHGGPAFEKPVIGALIQTFFDKFLKEADVEIELAPESEVAVEPLKPAAD